MKTAILISIVLTVPIGTFSQTKNVKESIHKIYNDGNNIHFFTGDNQGGYFLGDVSNIQGKAYDYASNSNAREIIDRLFYLNRHKINSVAFTPEGDGWVIIYGDYLCKYYNIPITLERTLEELQTNGTEINFVQFANTGGWLLVYDYGYGVCYEDFPSDAGNAISKRHKEGHKIKSISFTPAGGWVLVFGHNGYESSNAPKECINTLTKIYNKKYEIYSVSFTEFSEYVILTEEGIYHNFMDNYQIDNYQNTLGEYAPWSFLDLNGFSLKNGIGRMPCINIRGDNILTIDAVHIRDNGEHPSRDPAALGIEILYSDNAEDWYFYNSIPLVGLHYEGIEEKGYCKGTGKFEWYDDEAIKYDNYGILDWDYWPRCRYIRFRIIEGDHEHDPNWAIPKNIIKYSPLRWIPGVRSALKDDIIFDVYTSTEVLQTGMIVKLRGYERNHATLWLRTKRIN